MCVVVAHVLWVAVYRNEAAAICYLDKDGAVGGARISSY